ncbi:hypothetical protein POM88_035930 [Heracleum sosnowskyi]|uniref:Uncharacterized protein n=1 Tax=Heracleum sosnowskyi TaxID=360622 RepID=A0AAD8HP50_9APIA|nr:hypothetical protein POM88_035930 [Heracleum sosnowskyi]
MTYTLLLNFNELLYPQIQTLQDSPSLHPFIHFNWVINFPHSPILGAFFALFLLLLQFRGSINVRITVLIPWVVIFYRNNSLPIGLSAHSLCFAAWILHLSSIHTLALFSCFNSTWTPFHLLGS